MLSDLLDGAMHHGSISWNDTLWGGEEVRLDKNLAQLYQTGQATNLKPFVLQLTILGLYS